MRGQLLSPGDLLTSSSVPGPVQLTVILSNFTTLDWATRRMKAYRKQRSLRQLLYKHEHAELVIRRPAHRAVDDVMLWNADER